VLGHRSEMVVPATRTAVVLSWAALLGFLARSIIDFRYVYVAQMPDLRASVVVIVVYTVFVGGWVGALLALAAGQRTGALACLGLLLLPILLGVSTEVAFCPTPCGIAAPVGDILNWVCLALGVASAISLIAYLRSPGPLPSTGG
jgi:hypothetical protein